MKVCLLLFLLIFVTGSTDGIGLAYAKELAKRHVNVVLISRTRGKLEKVAAEIENEYKVETKIIVADFSHGESVYEHIKSELKNIPVGILVNNVGIYVPYPMPFHELSDRWMWDMLNINCGAMMAMTKMLIPQMQQRNRGAIVNVSSMAELQYGPLTSMYAASKIFVNRFSEALRFENREYGITVQVLAPYFISTNITANFGRTKWLNLVLDATQYAQDAINTLGSADHTAGSWIYGLLNEMSEMVPTCLKVRILNFLLRRIRRDYLASLTPEPSSKLVGNTT